MGALKQNIKFAIRTLVHNKGFSLAALLACLLPAWRASRVEPMEALRLE